MVISTSTDNCISCGTEKHQLYSCTKFRSLPHAEKIEILRSKNYCLNCLRPGHFVRKCRSLNHCKCCQRPQSLQAIFYFIGLAISGIPSSTNAQTIIQTTLQNERYACSNAEVIFTCRTVGLPDILWRSTDYIGSGGAQIGFIGAASDPPARVGSLTYPSTVATLTNETGSGESLVLESTLRIRTSLLSSNSSVTCTSTTNNLIDTISFTVLSDANMPSEMISNQTMDAKGTCTLHLSWRPPVNKDSNDLSHYMIHIDGENVVNKTHTVTNTSSLQLFAHPLCTCGDHTVSIQAVSRCGRAGSESESVRVVPLPLSPLTCDALTTEPIPTTQNEEIINLRKEVKLLKSYKSDLTGIAAFLSLVLVVLGGIIITFMVLYARALCSIKQLKNEIKNAFELVKEDEVKMDQKSTITEKKTYENVNTKPN